MRRRKPKRRACDTDLSDGQWALIAPLIPEAEPGGRPRRRWTTRTLLHTHHWRAAASYVALTRQRESAQVFVAEDTARDAHQLVRQMGRGEVRAASVA